MDAPAMLLDQSANRGGTKQASPTDLRVAQKVVHHATQVMGQPVIDRSGEPGLRLFQDVRRKNSLHGAAKNVLGGGPQRSFELEFGRHVPGDELDELTIQKWDTHLDG